MIRRLTTLTFAISLLLFVISVFGMIYPRLIKFPRPGCSPLFLELTGSGIKFGNVSYVDQTTGIILFSNTLVRVDSGVLAIVFALPTIIRKRESIGRVLSRPLGRKSRPNPQAICTVCGYDLRASPKRCPECGTLVPVAPWYDPARVSNDRDAG